MSILEEFWYGNIEPTEYDTSSSKGYKELFPLISKNEEKLLATMTDAQKDLFSRYQDCVREFQAMAECLLFQNSFRLRGQDYIRCHATRINAYTQYKKNPKSVWKSIPILGSLVSPFRNSHIKSSDQFRRRLHIPGSPPFHSFGKASCQVVDQEILRYFLGEQHGIPGEQLGQILLEIGHEQAVTIGGEDAADVYLVFLQMVENMAQLQLQVFAVRSIFFLGKQIREYMVEDLTAQAAQQIVLGFKMGIEGAAADIGFVNDLLHGNGAVLLLLHQCPQSLKNGISCFLLPSVHTESSCTFFGICSVMHRLTNLVLVFSFQAVTIDTEHFVL